MTTYLEVSASGVPSSAIAGVEVPVSITLKALRGPATAPNPLYAMRVSALYQRHPFMATTPVPITITPASAEVSGVGDEQEFVGTFTMPEFDVEVLASLDYKEAAADDWSTQEYHSSVVTAGSPSPAPIDIGQMMSLMITVALVAMMMKMMAQAM